MMKKLTLTTLRYGIVAMLCPLAFSGANVSGQEGVPRTLEGVWEVKVTPRDCTTGDPLPSVAGEALYTFHKDGTMISWYSSGTPSTGQGLWRHKLGWSDYSFRLVRILRSGPPANLFSGKQEIGGTVTLSESGNEYTSDEYTIIYNLDGVPGPTLCISSIGTRFTQEK